MDQPRSKTGKSKSPIRSVNQMTKLDLQKAIAKRMVKDRNIIPSLQISQLSNQQLKYFLVDVLSNQTKQELISTYEQI